MVKRIIHPIDGYHLRALFIDFLRFGANGVDVIDPSTFPLDVGQALPFD
jgi:hypothetical protein